MTIHVRIISDSTPTLALIEAINQVMRGERIVSDRRVTTMLITPRCTSGLSRVTADGWYDVTWSIPAVCYHDGSETTREGCSEGIGVVSDGEWFHYTWRTVEYITAIGAPENRPLEERISEAGPVSTDHLSDEEVRVWYGSRAEAHESLRRRRDAAVRRDTSAGRYDWKAYAQKVKGLYDLSKPPKLTAGERVISAAYRRQKAVDELNNATASAGALMRNAEEANKAEGAKKHGTKSGWARMFGVSRPTVDSWMNPAAVEDIEEVS